MSIEQMAQEDGGSMDIVKDNIDKLKEIFPDVFTEGKVAFDALKATLGEYVETGEERYSFNWHGKAQARRIAQTPSTGTLRPCPEESVDWDSTKNLFIEGDNLEVLKLLQKSYHKKVKMIYIDPPYNTGNEFIYPDNYRENLDTYLKYTGQKDDEGHKFSTNTESTGRYHTNWLNMMYPRLKLARNLLKEDGVMIISIDEHEVANLKKLCDEIFGEENGDILVWRKNSKQGNTKKISRFKITHEYLLICYKNKATTGIGKVKLLPNWKGQKSNQDNDPRGKWESGVICLHEDKSNSSSVNFYSFKLPSGRILTREFYFPKEELNELISDNRIFFPRDGDGVPRLKIFENEEREYFFDSVIDEMGTFTSAKEEVGAFFNNRDIFDTPKPTKLLKELIRAVCADNKALILDFFAGSGSFAHAALQLNNEINRKLRCISVQLPEQCSDKTEAYKAEYKTIADIGKERIRRAAAKIKEENSDYDGDLGFKVLKLDSSNIKPWDADFEDLEGSLLGAVDNIKSERSEEDVLYEILLKYGLDLTLPIETRVIAGKKVFLIGLGALVICLDSNISLAVVEGIGKLKAELEPEVMRVVFKDKGFKDDVVKTNAIQILKRYDIEDVKSL